MSVRSQLLWFGRRPPAAAFAACHQRGLVLCETVPPVTDAVWASARGAVVALEPATAVASLADADEAILKPALRHGLKVFVSTSLAVSESVKDILRRLPHAPQITMRIDTKETEIPEEVRNHDPGPPWSGELEPVGHNGLEEEDVLLLRRAFGNCTKVTLVPQEGGRSAKVFCAYARLRDSRAGPLPLPYFAKLDRRNKIERELGNYGECTTLFVPFAQRPNLDLGRCALGLERGIIVGNYVDESESLLGLVDRGTGRQALESLFNGALRNWRAQAHYDETGSIVTEPLHKGLEYLLPSSWSARRRRRLEHNLAAAGLGAPARDPDDLGRMLEGLPPMTHRRALMHGDLHGQNVRVAGSTAILIDFNSIQRGPLVWDPASLDVALAMCTTRIAGDAWRRFNAVAFELQCLLSPLRPADPSESGAGLWDCLRQIRQVGLMEQLAHLEYATAVALHMLFWGSHEAREEPGRRGYAYVLAEKLIVGIVEAAAERPAAPTIAPTPVAAQIVGSHVRNSRDDNSGPAARNGDVAVSTTQIARAGKIPEPDVA